MTDIRDTSGQRQTLYAAAAPVRVTSAQRQAIYSGAAQVRVTSCVRQVLMAQGIASTPEGNYEILPDPPAIQPTTQEAPVFKPLLRRNDVTGVLNNFASTLQAYLSGVVDKNGGTCLRQGPIDANGKTVQVGSTSSLPFSAVTVGYLDAILGSS